MNQIILTIIIFAAVQLINVILQTAKTLILAKSDNMHYAAIANAVAFGFYAIVIKQIAATSLTITVVVTILTNIIGIYITYAIKNKMRKDNLWKVEVYIEDYATYLKFEQRLLSHELSYKMDNSKFIVVYCYNQNESHYLREIIQDCDKETEAKIKYNVTEITKRL